MRITSQAHQHGITASRGSTVREGDSVWGYLVSVTDDNGKTHNTRCSQQAEGSLSDEAAMAGFNTAQDFVESWNGPDYGGYTADGVLTQWLSDGTVECTCDDD